MKSPMKNERKQKITPLKPLKKPWIAFWKIARHPDCWEKCNLCSSSEMFQQFQKRRLTIYPINLSSVFCISKKMAAAVWFWRNNSSFFKRYPTSYRIRPRIARTYFAFFATQKNGCALFMGAHYTWTKTCSYSKELSLPTLLLGVFEASVPMSHKCVNVKVSA